MANRQTRETLKNYLEKFEVGADKISLNPNYAYTQGSGNIQETKEGLGLDPNTNTPLIYDAKNILGDYLKYILDENPTPIPYKLKQGEGNNKFNTTVGKVGENLNDPDNFGFETFTNNNSVLNSNLGRISNSGQFNSLGSISDKINMSKNYEEKLKDIKGRNLGVTNQTYVNTRIADQNNTIIAETQKLFSNNNRFSNVGSNDNESEAASAFARQGISSGEFENEFNGSNNGSINLQNEFGEYDQNNFKTSLNELKEIGASLLIKASGFGQDLNQASDIPINDLEDNIKRRNYRSKVIVEGESIDPSANTPNYTESNFKDLQAKFAKGFPDNEGASVRQGRGEFVDANNSNTYGASFNTAYQFNDQNFRLRKIHAALYSILVATISKKAFNVIKDTVKKEEVSLLAKQAEDLIPDLNSTPELIKNMLGMYVETNSAALELFKSNILTRTDYNYEECFLRGILVIFDYNASAAFAPSAGRLAKSQKFGKTANFWLSVSSSILKIHKRQLDDITNVLDTSVSASDIKELLYSVFRNNKLIEFYNVMATIGEVSLKSTNGSRSLTSTGKFMRDVDSLPDSPASRVGKSRKKRGNSETNLSIEQSDVPSSYLLPANIIRAASLLDNSVLGENPTRGLLGSKLAAQTYTSIGVDGAFNRIPKEVVKNLEDRLDAEYVPFYFHDLRTNEIISFHAFLSDLSDTITAEYQSTKGYGRLDPVQTYSGTTRSLSFSFTVMATNRQDFDAMWVKINKLVTLLYPQWTQGTLLANSNGASRFYQPFSQVLGASPIMRLRIGDVIKSNYSRFSLARTFGIGDREVAAKPLPGGVENALDTVAPGLMNVINAGRSFVDNAQSLILDSALYIWLSAYGSPIGTATTIVDTIFGQSGANAASRLISSGVANALSELLINGFVAPWAVSGILNQLSDPNLEAQGQIAGSGDPPFDFIPDGLSGFFLRKYILRPNTNKGYLSKSGKRFFTQRRLQVRLIKKEKGLLRSNRIDYEVKVVDPNADSGMVSDNLLVTHADILPDPGEMFLNSIAGIALLSTDLTGLADLGADDLKSELTKSLNSLSTNLNVPNEAMDAIRMAYASDESKFMDPANNPFVRAFDTTKGRGLAGVFKSVTFNWLQDDFLWETDFNARAPIGCKVQLQFDVIHDIPPGLDHSGYNRAPLYNVGEIMKHAAGDVYSDTGDLSEDRYKLEGVKSSSSSGND